MSDREMWGQWIKSREGKTAVNTRPSTHKYGARAVRVDGILFDSTREAARYQELKLLATAGLITDLEIHPGWPLLVVSLEGPPWVFQTVGKFHADFRYRDLRSGTTVVEDVKSKPTKTEAYQLRKRIVEAVHGLTIVEIT